jgi:hypothetical protein
LNRRDHTRRAIDRLAKNKTVAAYELEQYKRYCNGISIHNISKLAIINTIISDSSEFGGVERKEVSNEFPIKTGVE